MDTFRISGLLVVMFTACSGSDSRDPPVIVDGPVDQQVEAPVAVVNIKAFGADGQGVTSYTIGGPPSVPTPPLVTLDLPAGSYRLSDAWGQPGALYDAWNYQGSVSHGTWGWAYMVYKMATAGGFEVLLDVRGPWVLGDCLYCFFDSEAQAAEAASSYPAKDFSLTEPTTLVFAVPDYALLDNLGGVSLLVTRIGP